MTTAKMVFVSFLGGGRGGAKNRPHAIPWYVPVINPSYISNGRDGYVLE